MNIDILSSDRLTVANSGTFEAVDEEYIPSMLILKIDGV